MITFETITVLADRRAEALKELEKLAKKARRYGCPDIRVREGERRVEERRITEWDGSSRKVQIALVDLLVEGEAPRVGEYEFLARVELGQGANLVDTVPGTEGLEERFRHTNGACEHCNAVRDRRQVYVVRSLTDGQQLQVGRQCLRDFLGIDDPKAVAQRFAFFRGVKEFSEGGGAAWGFHASLQGLMELTAVAVRLFGWCSKLQAGIDGTTPTAYYVRLGMGLVYKPDAEEIAMKRRLQAELNDDDREHAARVIRWVREDLVARSEYEHNLKVLFEAEAVTDSKRMGLVVSAVAAHARAMDAELRRTKERKERAASQWVGAEGERLKGLLVTKTEGRVVSGGQWGDCVLVKFQDEAGNILTWFTNGGSGLQDGEKCRLDGTVKRHTEYKGAKETQLSRCKIVKEA